MPTTATRVMAARIDGYGFMIGHLRNVERIHGHRVYTIKTLAGNLVRLSSRQYRVTAH